MFRGVGDLGDAPEAIGVVKVGVGFSLQSDGIINTGAVGVAGSQGVIPIVFEQDILRILVPVFQDNNMLGKS